MKGDFTRSTFDPRKHYSGVRMQQGRVQLDADWNENLDILRRRIETETIDVIGECGVPLHAAGFGVVTNFNLLPKTEQDWLTSMGLNTLANGNFFLTQGRAYVDGLLVENEHSLPFDTPISAPGVYQLYLDVWERHISAIEDPSIREVALGGPDTATRMQIIWQARLAQVGKPGDIIVCADEIAAWPTPSTGRISARTHPEDLPEDPCSVPPGAGYKRLENQLYRVEMHAGTETGTPTFKWARDNGSVLVAITEFAVDGANDKIRTAGLGRDDVLGLHENDWVEVLDDASELAGLPGTLLQITQIDPDNILSLSQPVSGYAITGHPKLRRWDSEGAIPVSVPATNDGYLKIEGGIEIKFSPGSLKTGDYWLIPARSVPGLIGDIHWEQDSAGPAALLPFGIIHHYCKLAILTVTGSQSALIISVEDCRKKFPPLTELPAGDHCCSVTVGPGGDFADIQSAVDARPQDADWWTVCILPGIVQVKQTIVVKDQTNLTFSGCGNQCRIYGPQGKPIFAFQGGDSIRFEGLYIQGFSPQGALLFSETDSITFTNCTAANSVPAPVEPKANAYMKGSSPAGPVLVIDDASTVEISTNDLFGLPAVQISGSLINISSNRIMGGGIQVLPPSAVVNIEDNLILKGAGPGVQLGGANQGKTSIHNYNKVKAASGLQPAINPAAAIRMVTISRNLIGSMAGSGIITETDLLEGVQLSDVEDLTISANKIIGCSKKPEVILAKNARVGGGIALLGIFRAHISNNLIAENGLGRQAACGIFILDGSDIDISGNRILENGAPGNEQKDPDTYQAGIAAQFIFGNLLTLLPGQTGQEDLKTGYPALRIHDNQVICPAGQALTVSAMGGVMIDGNTLVTRERKAQPTSPLNFGEQGACVFVFDLGLPIWLPEFAILLQMMAGGNVNLHLDAVEQVDNFFARFPDGRSLFHNNQVNFNTAVTENVPSLGDFSPEWFQKAWQQATFSALFIGLDDISLQGNQFQASVPLYVLIGYQQYLDQKISIFDFYAYLLKFMQVGSVGTIIRANGNGLSERIYSNLVSYASNAALMNVTSANEATHSFVTNAPKKSEANNLSLT